MVSYCWEENFTWLGLSYLPANLWTTWGEGLILPRVTPQTARSKGLHTSYIKSKGRRGVQGFGGWKYSSEAYLRDFFLFSVPESKVSHLPDPETWEGLGSWRSESSASVRWGEFKDVLSVSVEAQITLKSSLPLFLCKEIHYRSRVRREAVTGNTNLGIISIEMLFKTKGMNVDRKSKVLQHGKVVEMRKPRRPREWESWHPGSQEEKRLQRGEGNWMSC